MEQTCRLRSSVDFLEINNENLKASDHELVDLVLKTTAGRSGSGKSQSFSDPTASVEAALFSPYPRRSVRDIRRQERVCGRCAQVSSRRQHSDGLEEFEPTDRNDATLATRRRLGLATIVPWDASQSANRTAARAPAARGLLLARQLASHRSAELFAGHRG